MTFAQALADPIAVPIALVCGVFFGASLMWPIAFLMGKASEAQREIQCECGAAR